MKPTKIVPAAALAVFLFQSSGLSLNAQSDFSKRFLIIDHLFIYNNPTVDYRITVKGKVQVTSKMEGFVRVKQRDGSDSMTTVSSLSGEGTIKVTGRGSMKLGKFSVKKINYDSTMTAILTGKTRFVNAPENNEPREFANLALKENWDGDFTWDIETSDPKNDSLRLDMLKMMVPRKIPNSPHTGRTLEYYVGPSPKNNTYEKVDSVPGMGTFRWRYTYPPGDAHDPGRDNTTVNPAGSQANFDDDRPKPKDYINPPPPKLGPPIEQIDWDLVDLSKIPKMGTK